MSKVHIVQYHALWDMDGHFGRIQLRGQNGTWSPTKEFKDPAEFQVILDLLRNERPIYHDIDSDRIGTTIEPIGEGE